MRDLSLWISGCGVGSVVAEHAVSCSMARGILVPWPGTEPASPGIARWILNHSNTRGVPCSYCNLIVFLSKHVSNIYEQVLFVSAGEWKKMRTWCIQKMAPLSLLCCRLLTRRSPTRVSNALTSPSWGFSQCFLSVKLLPQPKHCVGNMGMGCQVWHWILITSYSVSSGKIGHGLCHEGKAMCCWGKDTWCGITHNACARRGFFWGADKIPRTIILSDLAEKRPTNCQLVSKLDTRG